MRRFPFLLVSNIFNDTKDKLEKLEFSTLISCNDMANKEPNNVTINKINQSAVFKAEPHSFYICKGIINFEGKTYQSNELKIQTKDGIPSKPLGLELVSVSPTAAHVKWITPSVINGESILDYLVEIVPKCQPKDNQDHCKTICPKPIFIPTIFN